MAHFVLAHGFTQTGASWEPIAAQLRGHGHTVVTPDLPGHGAAASVRADLPAAADLLAADGGPATYVGYSMGGRLALHVALLHPDVVQRLVLISATAGIDDPAERAARLRSDEARAAELDALDAGGGEVGGADGSGNDGLADWLTRWLAQPLFATLPAQAAGLDARLSNTAAGLASSLRLAGTGTQEPLWPQVGRLRIPVLVMAGERDATYVAVARRLVDAIGPNARLQVIAGAGHAAHLERPEAIVAALTSMATSASPS